jgi:hypothetical protein
MLVNAIHQDGAISNCREMVFHNVKPNLLNSEFRMYITESYKVWRKWCIKHICLLTDWSVISHLILWNVVSHDGGGRGGGVCVNICVPS